MATVISISNQKGGVGKTTTTCTLALGFRERGFRVLAIDMDPQGNLGFCMGADCEVSATIYDVLKGDCKAQYAIQKGALTDVVTSDILLSSIELEFTDANREFLLKDALEPLQNLYDYIFIDTPPALSILTVNSFAASDWVIIPMLSDIFSLQGITQLHETVQRVRRRCNPNVQFLGILLNRHNPRTLFASEIQGTVNHIAAELEIPVLATSIRQSVIISEAQAMQRSVFKYSPKNNVSKDFKSLVDELIAKGV